MLLEELIQELGYLESNNYWTASSNNLSTLSAHYFAKAIEAGVIGAYVYHANVSEYKNSMQTPQVVVYVAKAQNRSEAQILHRKLWNLGTAPFIIIVLPSEIRIYNGFNYNQTNDHDNIIISISEPTIDLIREVLSDFYAQEIDSGQIWYKQANNIRLSTRVDRQLLKNLNDLGDILVHQKKLAPEIAHALIGKYIYILYLRQRDIISDEWLFENDININQVLGRNATLKELLKLVDILENRFNGKVFPIKSYESLTDEVISYIASVFHGDDAKSGQLALEFRAYDFSYIPIEVISLIYEQFLHREGRDRAVGAYYTPLPLAEYLINEIHYEAPLFSGMKILDPCCGSGIFLVLAYRRLIELELAKHPSNNVSALRLSEILQESIFGVERNIDACYVTEFSLLLTLLSYIKPPDLHCNKSFKFPILHNNNIFQCDFFDDQSIFWKKGLRFDWVIGNPPWINLNEKRINDMIALEWINKIRSVGKFVDLQRLCDAFCWRTLDVLNDNGYVGLVIHAKSLTNDKCKNFRKSFFKYTEVKRVSNFSNLAYRLFAGRAEAPAATIIFTTNKNRGQESSIVHYGPFAINQLPTCSTKANKDGIWTIIVYQDEISKISTEEAQLGNAQTWKIALWGSYRDKRAIERLRHLFPRTLGELCAERKWRLEKGLQFWSKESDDRIDISDQIRNIPLLNTNIMNKSKFRFSIPKFALDDIIQEQLFVRKRSGTAGLLIVKAPHIFITSNFAAYSEHDFVFPHAKIGLSAPKKDSLYLKALTIILNSSIIRYLLFFQSSSWGSDRSIIEKNEVANIPVPILSNKQIIELAEVYEKISRKEQNFSISRLLPNGSIEHPLSEEQQHILQSDCDCAVERILNIPERIVLLIKDFWEIKYKLIKGKTDGYPSKPPTFMNLKEYALCLRTELDNFAEAFHKIVIRQFHNFIVCTISLTDSRDPIEPSIYEWLTSDIDNRGKNLWSIFRNHNSQWPYTQQEYRIFENSRVHIYKRPRLLDWSKTQALLDADDVISEVLAHKGLSI